MPLDRLIETSGPRQLLERMVTGQRLSHSLLFWGPSGSGKSAAAIELARWLNCRKGIINPCVTTEGCGSCQQFATLENLQFQYLFPMPARAFKDPDAGELEDEGAVNLHEILKEKGAEIYSSVQYREASRKDKEPERGRVAVQNILIGQIRALIRWATIRSMESYPRIALIDQADCLREEAANALLKLLEEPPPNFILILTAPTLDDILPTLKSRCQAVEFHRFSVTTIENVLKLRTTLDQAAIARMARLSNGDLSRALKFAAEPEQTKELIEQSINLVRHSLSRNPIDFHGLLEKWAGWDLQQQLLVLEIMAAWLRDAAVVKVLGSQAKAKVLHEERIDLLEKFVTNCPQADFATAVQRVDVARWRLEGNTLAPLTLLSLSRDLYRAIYRRAAV